MAQKHTLAPLYAANAGNDSQGLIIEESTGRTVAVTYDREDAAFIVKACNSYERLLEAAKPALELLDALWGEQWLEHGEAESDPTIEHLRDTIDYAAVEQETVPV